MIGMRTQEVILKTSETSVKIDVGAQMPDKCIVDAILSFSIQQGNGCMLKEIKLDFDYIERDTVKDCVQRIGEWLVQIGSVIQENKNGSYKIPIY